MVLQLPGLLTNPLFKHSKAAEDGFSRYRDIVANKHFILLPAGCFMPADGALREEESGHDSIKFPNGSTTRATANFPFPSNSTGTQMKVTFLLVCPVADGNVRCNIVMGKTTSGQDVPETSEGWLNSVTPVVGNQLFMYEYTFKTIKYLENDLLFLRMFREGAHFLDTESGDFHLLGAKIEYE